jgi:hypothetical protein
LSLPAQEHPFEQIVVHFGQHGGEDGLFGAANFSGVRIASKFQGAQLPWAKRVRVDGQVGGPAYDPLGGGHNDQTNQPGHRIG